MFSKFLSILLGDSEEERHATKAVISNSYGMGNLSTQSEKEYVLKKLINYLPYYVSKEFYYSEHPGVSIAIVIDNLIIKKGEEKFLQAFNRVMVHFYNYEFNNKKSLQKAFILIGEDIRKYIL